jgi:hypothetical protein
LLTGGRCSQVVVKSDLIVYQQTKSSMYDLGLMLTILL